MAVLAPLAALDAQQHALGIDVGNLERFRDAQPSAPGAPPNRACIEIGLDSIRSAGLGDAGLSLRLGRSGRGTPCIAPSTRLSEARSETGASNSGLTTANSRLVGSGSLVQIATAV